MARRGASGAACENVGLRLLWPGASSSSHAHPVARLGPDGPDGPRPRQPLQPARRRAPNDIIMSSITFDTLHTNTDQSNHIEHQATTSTTDVAPHGASWNKMQTHRRPCAPLPTAEKNEPASRSLARAPVSPSSDLLTEELWVSSSFTRSSAVLPLVPCCGVVVRLSGADVAPPCSPVVLLPETGRVCPSHAYLASATCACREASP